MASETFAGLTGEKLLQTLQEKCVTQGASDIHLSPQKGNVRLEWRLHGVLQLLAAIDDAQYVDLLRHVKFQAKLKLNITNLPQDGQYVFASGTRTVNVRVATLPSRFGEALTLRFLDPERGIRPLTELGFPAEMEKTLRDLAELPNGLVLVTGPTGSGKTTTLYALLSTIVGRERNIITLEDPVEYEIPGIIQSEIAQDQDYSFASGLRSILRHDPDVILVGEIRDLETAQTAVNAALTGHLVLSTLHTNSAVEAIPRLLSMGVSPFTLAPSLRAVLAQRLVRTVTKECAASGTCNPSDNASYNGQCVVPELVIVTPEMQKMILNMEPSSALETQARKDGFVSMREAGEKLIQEKKTTKEEVERVTM